MFEPPANTGAMPPSTPGRREDAELGRVRHAVTDLVARVVLGQVTDRPAGPARRHDGRRSRGGAVRAVVQEVPVGHVTLGARRRSTRSGRRPATSRRPLMVFGSDSVDVHWPPSCGGQLAAVGEHPRDAVAPVLAAHREAGLACRCAAASRRAPNSDRVVRHAQARRRPRGPCGRTCSASRSSRARRSSCRRPCRPRRTTAAACPRRARSYMSVMSANAPIVVNVGRLRVADLDHVRGVLLVRQGRGQLGDQVAPVLLLDRQRRAGVLVGERLDEVVAQLLGGVTTGDPQGDLSAIG